MHLHSRLAAGIFCAILQTPAAAQVPAFRPDDTLLAQRLNRLMTTNESRLEELNAIFQQAGCSGERLTRQPVKGHDLPNLLCTIPGSSPETVIVGAHFDFGGPGTGAIDNWSGASMLPSLYQSLAARPRHLTYILAGFSGEESGLLGSKHFVREWSKAKRPEIVAMINVDSVGMGPVRLWVSRADRRLVDLAAIVAARQSIEVTGVNVEKVGDSDSKEFAARKVPVLDVHSVTQATFPLLHSSDDTLAQVHFPSYKETFLFVLGLLEAIDATGLPPAKQINSKSQ